MGCTRSPFSGGFRCCAFCTGPVNPDVITLAHMPSFKIIQNVGVGPVKLGMTRQQVRSSLIDCPDLDQKASPTLDYAYGNSLQIEYDSDGNVRFIGIGYSTGCGCDYEFCGRHIGDYTALELFDLLSELDGGNHVYNPDSYFFPLIMMNVWEADEQYDSRNGESNPVYGQVGIANRE